MNRSLRMSNSSTPMPVSTFGMAVGTLALAQAWRVAVRLWGLPPVLADAAGAIGLAVWLVVSWRYARQWFTHPDAMRAELAHPLQSSFVALAPVSSLLAAITLRPLAPQAATLLLGVAIAAQLALGLWLYGRFWQGGRRPEQVTPAVYLPAVAQNFVAGTAAAAFGWTSLGAFFFGAGLFSWLAIESLLLGRAALGDPLTEATRPLVGIQLAPAVVGGGTWMSLTSGVPDLFAQALLGYGLYQALLLLRLLPWIRAQRFAPSYWAFSFGVAALPSLAMRMAERGAGDLVQHLALPLFVASNVVIATLAWKTLAFHAEGRRRYSASRPA